MNYVSFNRMKPCYNGGLGGRGECKRDHTSKSIHLSWQLFSVLHWESHKWKNPCLLTMPGLYRTEETQNKWQVLEQLAVYNKN